LKKIYQIGYAAFASGKNASMLNFSTNFSRSLTKKAEQNAEKKIMPATTRTTTCTWYEGGASGRSRFIS
jgi:hypothetical protein